MFKHGNLGIQGGEERGRLEQARPPRDGISASMDDSKATVKRDQPNALVILYVTIPSSEGEENRRSRWVIFDTYHRPSVGMTPSKGELWPSTQRIDPGSPRRMFRSLATTVGGWASATMQIFFLRNLFTLLNTSLAGHRPLCKSAEPA
ncbi:hypothetical protein GFS31_04530 [Leptolyngbya sp. BL0902]|nr:hypothetical protein GFS31_04530 [Leptolyngbya sp. BL0902]